MRTVEEDRELVGFEIVKKPAQIAFQFGLESGLGGFGFSFTQLHHHLEILQLRLGLQDGSQFFSEVIGFVDEFLGLFAIVPEVFRRHQGVDFA